MKIEEENNMHTFIHTDCVATGYEDLLPDLGVTSCTWLLSPWIMAVTRQNVLYV